MRTPYEPGTRCLLIQSRFSDSSFWNYVDVCKLVGAKYPAAPLGLMTVAALLPQEWEFKLVDANVEPLLDAHFEWADIVCTGGMLPQQHGIRAVIERAHRHGCPVVVGGPDPTSQPALYDAADYRVLGEGEATIPLFLQDLERGATSGTYRSADRPDMTQAVVPRFDLIRFRDYVQVGIQFSRGCPFNCEFCDIIQLYGRQFRSKTPAQVLAELQALYDLGYRGHVDFVDDNFVGNKTRVKQLLPALRAWSRAHGYPFYFTTEASLELAGDDELLRMMRDVDFRFVFIGIETPEEAVLAAIHKKQNLKTPVARSVRKLSAYGMTVNGGFILGFDNESERIADHMIECIQSSGICMAMLGTLYALPNTQLTQRLEREGRLFEQGSTIRNHHTDVDQMTSGLNFITARPRLDILTDYARVLKHIYEPRHYFARVTHAGLHLKPANKYRPSFFKRLRTLKAFLKVCRQLGLNRRTGRLYWKMLLTVLLRNPRAIEQAVNLAAMFIHFDRQSRFIVETMNGKIEHIENHSEEHYNQLMLQEAAGANASRQFSSVLVE